MELCDAVVVSDPFIAEVTAEIPKADITHTRLGYQAVLNSTEDVEKLKPLGLRHDLCLVRLVVDGGQHVVYLEKAQMPSTISTLYNLAVYFRCKYKSRIVSLDLYTNALYVQIVGVTDDMVYREIPEKFFIKRSIEFKGQVYGIGVPSLACIIEMREDKPVEKEKGCTLM